MNIKQYMNPRNFMLGVKVFTAGLLVYSTLDFAENDKIVDGLPQVKRFYSITERLAAKSEDAYTLYKLGEERAGMLHEEKFADDLLAHKKAEENKTKDGLYILASIAGLVMEVPKKKIPIYS